MMQPLVLRLTHRWLIYQELLKEKEAWEAADPTHPVLIAFEIIGSVAQGQPAENGTYLYHTSDEIMRDFVQFTRERGIAILAETLQELGEVMVVAPERDRSGASSSLTLDRPLSVRRAGSGFLYVDGTPTDCVHVAVTGLLPHRPASSRWQSDPAWFQGRIQPATTASP